MRLEAIRRLVERLRSNDGRELPKDEQFTSSEINLGKMMLPLIQDLEEARKTIDILMHKSRAAEVALGLVPFAALLIGDEGQLLSSNTYAKTLFGGPAVPAELVVAAQRALSAHNDDETVVIRGNSLKLRIVPAELDDESSGLGVVFLIPEDATSTIDQERLVSRYGLTPAQARVAALVAQGLSNREVAEELGISPQTVHTHMQTILGKMQVANRAAVVAAVFGARFTQRNAREY